MSKTFKMNTDIEFEAIDIADAFNKVSEHFCSLYYECNGITWEATDFLDFVGTMEIKPKDAITD